MRRLPQALLSARCRPGKSAPPVTEQFALRQLFRQRAAVYGDKSALAAALGMNGASGQILARPCFSGDQHRAVRSGGAQYLTAQLRHGRRIADKPVKARAGGFCPPCAPGQPPRLKQQPHKLPDHAENRFGPLQQRALLERIERHYLCGGHDLTCHTQRAGIVGVIPAVVAQ